MRRFTETLADAFAAGRHLCVGIDPHAHLLDAWGLDDSADSAERMGRAVIAASAGTAAAVKPQIAFFERFGSRGYLAFERVLADARDAGVPVIADVKRGDIGTSFAAYAQSWLLPGSPLEADAMTAVAYQGFGSLTAALDLAAAHGKGVFVLSATSNPEARQTQTAVRGDGQTVARAIIEDAQEFNAQHAANDRVGPVGVVLGATLQFGDYGISFAEATTEALGTPQLPILAPGFGAQGARVADAPQLYGSAAPSLLMNESRSLLGGGERTLATRVRQRAQEIRETMQG